MEFHSPPVSSNVLFLAHALTTQGVGTGYFYIGGYYSAPAADANLTNASTTVNYGSANIAVGGHAFLVASAAGSTDGSDLVITVTGTSITDAGVRTGSDSEVIVADATAMATNQYFETTKKWIGTITYTLSSTGGTTFNADFNYGTAYYEDFGKRNFTVTDFRITGVAGATDAGFDVELLYHKATGWTYSAAAFVPGDSAICKMSTDYVTERAIASGVDFAYKRTNIGQYVNGSNDEGIIGRVTTTANNAVEFLNATIGVEF